MELTKEQEEYLLEDYLEMKTKKETLKDKAQDVPSQNVGKKIWFSKQDIKNFLKELEKLKQELATEIMEGKISGEQAFIQFCDGLENKSGYKMFELQNKTGEKE